MTADSANVPLPLPVVQIAKDGVINHIYHRRDEEGKLFRVEQTINTGFNREQSMARAAERKAKWTPYGSAIDREMLTEPSADSLPFKPVTNPNLLEVSDASHEVAARPQQGGSGNIKCRICEGPHWTRECPNKDLLSGIKDLSSMKTGSSSDFMGQGSGAGSMDTLGGSSSSGGAYVPPHLRGMNPGSTGVILSGTRRLDDAPSVRISNLPFDTTELDLQELASRCGKVVRSFLARYDDGNCKGYAFVNYAGLPHAENAVRYLNGYGFRNMILACEHSIRKEKPV